MDFVIVHVGTKSTNNVAAGQTVWQILAYYGDLIHTIKRRTNVKTVFTSIISRLCDFEKNLP